MSTPETHLEWGTGPSVPSGPTHRGPRSLAAWGTTAVSALSLVLNLVAYGLSSVATVPQANGSSCLPASTDTTMVAAAVAATVLCGLGAVAAGALTWRTRRRQRQHAVAAIVAVIAVLATLSVWLTVASSVRCP